MTTKWLIWLSVASLPDGGVPGCPVGVMMVVVGPVLPGVGETGGLAGGAVVRPVAGLPAATGVVAGGGLDGWTVLVTGLVPTGCEAIPTLGAETAAPALRALGWALGWVRLPVGVSA